MYFGFKKAFDCVPHLRMQHMLNELGTSGRLYSRTQNFLTNRTLQVKVGEECPKCIDAMSGVPQGYVLQCVC